MPMSRSVESVLIGTEEFPQSAPPLRITPNDVYIAGLINRLVASYDSDPRLLEACYAAAERALERRKLLIPQGRLDRADPPRQLFRERERALGPATLDSNTMELLFSLAEKSRGKPPAFVVRHPPSFCASIKQKALSRVCDAAVHKTVTLRFGDQLVLCTGAGDFVLDRPTLREIGRELDLSQKRRRSASINPRDVVPEIDLGLLRGIVSPFLPHAPQPPIASIFLLPPAESGGRSGVAIPISPCESLVVPAAEFASIVADFVRRHLPTVRLVNGSSVRHLGPTPDAGCREDRGPARRNRGGV